MKNSVPTPKPIIFDCDPGDDDAIALLMALHSPEEVKLLGVTASSGNSTVENTFENARNIVFMAGKSEIPVFKGCSIPLMKAPYLADIIHGEKGIGGVYLTPSKVRVEEKHAIDFIVDAIIDSSVPITLFVTGPMTNIAMAYLKEPKIKENIERIIMMGGARQKVGNLAPNAELNCYVDPHATQIILSAFNNVVMVSLDITYQVLAKRSFLNRLKKLKLILTDTVYELLKNSYNAEKKILGIEGRAVHDACVVAYFLQPELFSGKRVRVDVETHSPHSLGQTIVRWHDMHLSDSTPNCLFLDQVNAEAVLELIYSKLESLAKKREFDLAQSKGLNYW